MSTPTLQEIFDMKKESYSGIVKSVAQQKLPRFAGKFETIPLAQGQTYIEGHGVLQMYESNGRFVKPRYQDMSMFRRKISTKYITGSVIHDERTLTELLLSGQIEGIIRNELTNAKNRETDRIGFKAALDTVSYGPDGTSTITAANDGVRTLDCSGGMQYKHFNAIEAYFNRKEIGLDGTEPIYMGVTEEEQYTLRQNMEFINSLYSQRVKATEGQAGFSKIGNVELVTFGSDPDDYEPILSVDGSNVRSCICVARGGLIFGVRQQFNIELFDLTSQYDKKTWEIRASFEMGAVRMFGNMIINAQTTAGQLPDLA